MKKRIYILIQILVILFAKVGFVGAQDQKLNILTTIFPIYDFTRTVAGDFAEVSMLLPPGADSHSYEPTPRDILKIQNADLFIYIGGESDIWVDQILSSLSDKKPRTLVLIHSVNALPEEVVPGMQAEKESQSSDETDVVYDEHIWLSPLNAIKMADAIAASLTESDPAHAPDFESHRAALDQKLQELDHTFRDIVKSAKRQIIIVGDRFPFRYLTEEYGLEYYAAFPGCSAEVEPSASTVAFLIDKVKTEKIPVVFYIEFSTHKIADAIADATGAKTMLLHSAHNVSQEDIDSGITYLSIMTENAEKLREALN